MPAAEALRDQDLDGLAQKLRTAVSEEPLGLRVDERDAAIAPDDHHVRLGEYLEQTGSEDACLAAVERAVELVPAEPPSQVRAYSLASLAGALVVA